MPQAQDLPAAILQRIPRAGLYLTFDLHTTGAPLVQALCELARQADGEQLVLGVGQSLALALGRPVAGLRPFPQIDAPGLDAPATPAALWCWLRGDDHGALLLRGQALASQLAPAFTQREAVSGFFHGGDVDRDLSGYEDGTENPQGDDAVQAVAAPGGGSFVAVQKWVHDFARLRALREAGEMDKVIGRHHEGNREMEDAPDASHVARTDQESFAPPAHIVRRSMPWSNGRNAGLMFVAFGRSLDAFEVQWRRMMGAEDGVTDALFRFTRPQSGAYFWCPPVRGGQVDWAALGVAGG